VARSLAAAGARPVLAGRDQGRLTARLPVARHSAGLTVPGYPPLGRAGPPSAKSQPAPSSNALRMRRLTTIRWTSSGPS